MMSRIISSGLLTLLLLNLQSCFDSSKPNYQYFPNMYEPVGYETYADSDAFVNGIEAVQVSSGWNCDQWMELFETFDL